VTELLPTEQARDLRRGLLDYLTTTFALADSDAGSALGEFLTDAVDGIFKGPYLRLRLPFRAAEDGWQQAVTWTAGESGFVPYGHQARAFARLAGHDLGPGKSRPLPTLVTTGTGSGKTEAFLYPILEHVLRERRAGHAGVKALLLYPMNALANDQASRLATLLTGHETLKGITAGLYTGQQVETRTRVSEAGLITDRSILRDDPPDILLTNYKMLDQLLLRPDDQPLWIRSARSLQYLVLDEFHTYDGAQGTDVAMLLRRLGLALKSFWSDDDPQITAEERVRPLGMVTPVATSATLGDQGDPAAMVEFARTVFGEAFDETSVVTESRLDLPEWVGDAAAQVRQAGLEPKEPDLAAVVAVNDAVTVLLGRKSEAADSLSDQIAFHVLGALYGIGVDGVRADGVSAGAISADGVRAVVDAGLPLLALVKAHPMVVRLVGRTVDAAHLDALADDLFAPVAVGEEEPSEEERRTFLVHLVAMLSHVRAVAGRQATTVDLHLWVRELTRVDRVAASTPKYVWSDDGALVVHESHDPLSWEGHPAFPAVYCRHCGRSGWGVTLAPTGNDLDPDDTSIRRKHAAREGRFRALLYAPAEADHAVLGGEESSVEGLRWFAVKQRAVLAEPPPDDDPDFRDGWVLPVLALSGKDADEDSRDDTCPSCLQKDAIRFLGSAIATLLSVSLSTLFGDAALDAAEKKALVFTDSVQDAAHRAGFVQSRSHTMTLRSVLRSAIGEDAVSLDELVEEALRDAGDDPFRRYRLIPPDLADRPEFRPFWEAPRVRSVSAAVRKRARARLLFDAVMEFGLSSRVGRTLEATGSVVAEVSAASGLAAIARGLLTADDAQETLDAGAAWTSDEQLTWWVRGVLEHLRERGAVIHPWFADYVKEDGSRYRIWGGRRRGQGMPAFPKGRAAPAFPRLGRALPDGAGLLDPVTSPRSWYARWAARTLGVTPQHGARLAKALLERLARDNVLLSFATVSGGTVFALPPEAVIVAPARAEDLAAGRCRLECDVCRSSYPGRPAVTGQLAGAPCLLVRCPGRLRPVAVKDNYYRELYACSDPRRVVAREHSSLLDDETRVAYETAFKTGQADPRSANVLVATPTLEMGIDIGDLSAVLLASLPRTVASYLQRVGRAGRLTGNALNLAFVTGRGEHLPRLGDPLSVVNGRVRPPATYLNAEEILQRQYLAHLTDRMARTDRDTRRRTVRTAADVLARTTPGSFLADLITLAETETRAHLDRFLGAFDGLDPGVEATLRAWATPSDGPGSSGLAVHLLGAAHRWAMTVEELHRRRTAIQQALPQLKQVVELPAASDDDKRAFKSAEASRRLTTKMIAQQKDQFWVQAMEEYGLLPNYTLLDDSVTLDVAMTWIDPDTREYESEPIGYRRASRVALRDFAPGATFYGRGLEIEIDSVDLGVEGADVRPWAFCPACGYAVDRAAGGSPVTVRACPRCGDTGIADARQHLDAVELTKVSAEIRRDEAAITDRRDERHRERFTIFIAADVDPAHVARRWFVDGYDFGATYLRRMDIRWVNAGRVSGYGALAAIAGQQRPATFFRVCSGCGKLDKSTRTNRSDEHRAWCRFRKATQENTRTVALMRTLTTQGVVLRLPTTVTVGDVFAVPSLAAALLLGLHEHLGGSPDHLAVAQIADPTHAPGGGRTHEALLVHDLVPGGTGYLAELADPARLWALLHRAWQIVRDCDCGQEARLACHRCLLPFVGAGLPVDLVSRQAAERHLRALLCSGALDGEPGPATQVGWSLTDVPPDPGSTESHLEHSFRKVFRDRVGGLGATVKDVPGAAGNTLKMTFPGAQRQWVLEPQTPMNGCRPDFVLRSNDPNIPLVALFTDGWTYHASDAHNRLADDARKRAALRDQGVVVLAVTSQDVDQAATDTPGGRPGPAAPTWFSDAVMAQLLESGQFPLSSRTAEVVRGGPFAFLLQWLQQPQVAEQTALANALPLFFLPRAAPVRVPDGPLTPSAVALLADGTAADGRTADGSAAHWWRGDHLGVLFRLGQQGRELVTEIAVVLDDRATALGRATHPAAWREWLVLANVLNLSSQPVAVTTVTAAADAVFAEDSVLTTVTDAGEVAADVEEPEAVALAPQWRTCLEKAAGAEEKALVRDLARRPAIPAPRMGYESEDGIMIDAAWPEHKIAAYVTVDPHDREDLTNAGWQVLRATSDAVIAALEAAGAIRHTIGEGR
jgi:ATP-dependent helicase YprA (DUF1998 family)